MSAYFKNLAVGKRIAAVFALIIVLLVVVSAMTCPRELDSLELERGYLFGFY